MNGLNVSQHTPKHHPSVWKSNLENMSSPGALGVLFLSDSTAHPQVTEDTATFHIEQQRSLFHIEYYMIYLCFKADEASQLNIKEHNFTLWLISSCNWEFLTLCFFFLKQTHNLATNKDVLKRDKMVFSKYNSTENKQS